jgi:hypothetical protein
MFSKLADDIFASHILPPFLGELGYEIRYFVAFVEPWIRSGWRVVSSRPSLYPDGSVVECPEFYKQLKLLSRRYEAEPVHGKIKVDFGNRLLPKDQELARRDFENELRKLVLPLIDAPGRPITPLDIALTSAWRGHDDHFLYGYSGLAPSYKPSAFLNGGRAPRHVGVQFRKLGVKDPFRDSNVDMLFPQIACLASELGLPLFVYGEPEGCAFPAGCKPVSHFWQHPSIGLAGDLGCLASCEVMFAPDSGWADLMGWLQIPTILQSLGSDYTYFSMMPFKPRIRLLSASRTLIEQYHEVLATPPGSIDLCSPESNKRSHLLERFFDLNHLLGGQKTG